MAQLIVPFFAAHSNHGLADHRHCHEAEQEGSPVHPQIENMDRLVGRSPDQR